MSTISKSLLATRLLTGGAARLLVDAAAIDAGHGRPDGRAAGAAWAVGDGGGGRLIWSVCGGGVEVMPKGIYGIVLCTALDVVVMKMHDSIIGSRTGLWTMMFSAGVLAVLLACAGAAAGAAWVVDDGGGGSVDNYPLIQPWTGGMQQKGDLNDNEITPADAAIALSIAVGSRPFDDAADVSDDGCVTSLGALTLLHVAADAIDL